MARADLHVDGYAPVTGEIELEDSAPVFLHDFRVPAEGKFRQLKHDYECAEMNYRPRNYGVNPGSPNAALPETVHLNPFDGIEFVPFPLHMEEFQVALMAKADPTLTFAQLKDKWRALTVNSVAFTDKHSINYGEFLDPPDPTKNYRDDLLGENLYNPIPIAWKVAITCAGNLVKIITSNVIEAVDPDNLPDPDYVWQRPWLLHWAVEETIQELDGLQLIDGKLRKRYRCSPFPQMRPVGTPIVLWGRGGRTRISESWRIKPIINGATYSPYVP